MTALLVALVGLVGLVVWVNVGAMRASASAGDAADNSGAALDVDDIARAARGMLAGLHRHRPGHDSASRLTGSRSVVPEGEKEDGHHRDRTVAAHAGSHAHDPKLYPGAAGGDGSVPATLEAQRSQLQTQSDVASPLRRRPLGHGVAAWMTEGPLEGSATHAQHDSAHAPAAPAGVTQVKDVIDALSGALGLSQPAVAPPADRFNTLPRPPSGHTPRMEGRKALVLPLPADPVVAYGSFYGQAGHACKPTGMLSFSPPRLSNPGMRYAADAAPGSVHLDGAALTYTPWDVAWPRMVRQAHEAWFEGYEIASWRRST